MFSRDPSTVFASSRGWRASATRRPMRCRTGGISVDSCAANGVSRSARSVGGPVADHVRLAEPDLGVGAEAVEERVRPLDPHHRDVRSARADAPCRRGTPPAPAASAPRGGTATAAMRARTGELGGVGQPGPHALVRARDRCRGRRVGCGPAGRSGSVVTGRPPGDGARVGGRRAGGAATARCRAGGSGPTMRWVTSGRRSSMRTSGAAVAGRARRRRTVAANAVAPVLPQRHRRPPAARRARAARIRYSPSTVEERRDVELLAACAPGPSASGRSR